MGRGAVRTAIQAAIQSAAINYVGTVFAARPEIVQEDDYVETMNGQAIQESANGSACVIVVNLPGEDVRTLRSMVGGGGAVNDTNIIPVALELFFASTGGDGVAAQVDYDAIVDPLVAYIRGSPNMSAPASVWAAGEYQYGVRHIMEQPYTSEDGLTVLINGVVRFQAWTWESGYGV